MACKNQTGRSFPPGAAGKKRSFLRAERLDRMSRPGFGKIEGVAPWMACKNQTGRSFPPGAAGKKRSFVRSPERPRTMLGDWNGKTGV